MDITYANQTVTMSVTNRGSVNGGGSPYWHFEQTQTGVTHAPHSAECILERPPINSKVGPLPGFAAYIFGVEPWGIAMELGCLVEQANQYQGDLATLSPVVTGTVNVLTMSNPSTGNILS